MRHPQPPLPRLLLLTDRSQLPAGRHLTDTVRRCVDAGLRAVVVREHDLAAPAREALVAEVAALHPALTVLTSRRPAPAARGTHLASHQPPGTGWWGRSCHARAEIARAAREGASWVTLSPFALSASKPGHGPALPPEAYSGHPVDVFALAGVTPDNAGAAREAGAYGVAVMGGVMRAERPERVVARLLEVLR